MDKAKLSATAVNAENHDAENLQTWQNLHNKTIESLNNFQ